MSDYTLAGLILIGMVAAGYPLHVRELKRQA